MKFKALVKEIMKKNVITIDINASIESAAKIMKSHKIGSLIVIEAEKVKGIVTAEDIVYKHIADRHGKIVNDIMSKTLVTVSPEKSIEDASRIMVENKIKKLPVMEGEKLVGIITASDVVRVEPVLYELLLETVKIGERALKETPITANKCDICDNYTDDVSDIDDIFICQECSDFVK